MDRFTEILGKVAQLRQKLHGCPEPALLETETKQTLMTFLKAETTLKVTDMGKWFYVYVPGSGEGSVALRADFDAVQGTDGRCRHLCGHDGHASALAGVALLLNAAKPIRDVYCIFQPAEETGQGAVLCAPLLEEKRIERVFAWHNLPGYPLGTVMLINGTFACASTGLELNFAGTPAHAAYPENGANPCRAIAELILRIGEQLKQPSKGLVLATVIGIDAGGKGYGTSAYTGTLRLTVRGEYGTEFNALLDWIRSEARSLAVRDGLVLTDREIDRFPSTENDPRAVAELAEAAKHAGIPFAALPGPMRWSEDFGAFLAKTPGAMFGIGSGESCPALHTKDYSYPDAVTETAFRLYAQLLGI